MVYKFDVKIYPITGNIVVKEIAGHKFITDDLKEAKKFMKDYFELMKPGGYTSYTANFIKCIG